MTAARIVTGEQIVSVLADPAIAAALQRLTDIGMQVYLPQPIRSGLERGMVPAERERAVGKAIGAMCLVSRLAATYIDKRSAHTLERVASH